MIFFDSYAILEIIKGNPNYLRFGEQTIITNTLILSEVFYSLLKEVNAKAAEEVINKLNIDFLNIAEDIAIDSAILRYKNKRKKLSYADCIGYITALRNNMRFLTGDKEFKGMKNVEFVK